MFKVGDYFMIINPVNDLLYGEYKGPYKISSLVHEYGSNKPDADLINYVWFKSNDCDSRSQYVSKSNIRKLTKLERALK